MQANSQLALEHLRPILYLRQTLHVVHSNRARLHGRKCTLIPAIHGNFPQHPVVQSCSFHFCRTVLQQVNLLGVKDDYSQNEIRNKIKMLVPLVFLPNKPSLNSKHI
ncbi:hypothetical protein T4C_10958 [Trichinella pseudospiralis]|uniref:MULE transposase domain-containing protein n=1 Tax=Trichinella pseudospiralis TaxID=6337 RepID=A0A0V1KDV0_TRIPS|nr:hypothetical protein T4C_10958 [Trichinella pseudospiralis]